MVHDLSHMIFRARHPISRLRPHGREHARLEGDMAKYAIDKGWLDGALLPPERNRLTTTERRTRDLARTRAALKRWETKKKRATTAIRKLLQRERRLTRALNVTRGDTP
jgi:hypothetical protein